MELELQEIRFVLEIQDAPPIALSVPGPLALVTVAEQGPPGPPGSWEDGEGPLDLDGGYFVGNYP